MAGYTFESLFVCQGLRIDGAGWGLRGIASIWHPNSPCIMLFCRVHGTKPPGGVLYQASIHHFPGISAVPVWTSVISTDQRHRADRAINLYGSFFPDNPLVPGMYTATIELVSGDSVQTTFTVE